MNNEKREAIERAVIERAVEFNSGVWRSSDLYFIIDEKVMYKRGRHPMLNQKVCCFDEYGKVARELGYVNGYKYGVEYPTNGEKPDLPDDVLVKCKEATSEWLYDSELFDWDWGKIIAFRITDERYKPKDQPAELHEMGNWHDRRKLPPVGWKGQYGAFWHPCEVVAHHNGFAVVWDAHDLEYFRTNKSHIFRPIQTERDKVIQTAHAILGKSNREWCEMLYDAGMLKLPTD